MSLASALLLILGAAAWVIGYLWGFDRGHKAGAHDVLAELNRKRSR